jgi:hypothetical protein
MRSIALVFSLLVLGGSLAACHTKPPRQAEAADPMSDKGADMSHGEDGSGSLKGEAGTTKPSEDDMHAKCCASCKEGLKKNRSGESADKIPCADFTDTLSPWCLEHFRSKPTMASQCK